METTLRTTGSRKDSQRRQSGAALIVFLGIMAALGVMSIAILMLLTNSLSATSRDTSRTRAFDVAEAGVDVAMQMLSTSWPDEEGLQWTDATFLTSETSFLAQYSADAVRVRVIDDVDTNIEAAPGWDANSNEYLWIDSQATVNGVSSRIRAMVQSQALPLNLHRGVVVFAQGNLGDNGAGGADSGHWNIGVEDSTEDGRFVAAINVWGELDDGLGQLDYVDPDPDVLLTRQEVLSDQDIADLKSVAIQMGRYYDHIPHKNEPGADFTGLCVIEAPSGDVLLDQDVYNSVEDPGVLLVLGGATLHIGGGTTYYGVIYVQGPSDPTQSGVTMASGTPKISGMLVTDASVTMGGGAIINYNEDCLSNLDAQFQMMTTLVPNYWRELSPVD